MAVRSFPGTGGTGASQHGAGLSGATTGIRLTYTCPAGFQARVIGAWFSPTAGAATVVLRANFAGNVRQLQTGTTAYQLVGNLSLDAGDSVRFEVTVLDAASVFDAVISVEQYPVV